MGKRQSPVTKKHSAAYFTMTLEKPILLYIDVYVWWGWGGGSQAELVVKNLSADVGDVRDTGSIPGSGRSLEEGVAPHSSILAWRIPWTEEPDRLQSMG